MFTAFSLAYQAAFTTAPVFWRQLAMTTPSTTETNTYTWMEKIPKMREWLGPRVVHNLVAREPRIIPNRTFELTLGVPKQKILDDQYGVFTPTAAMMGMQAALWPDDLVSECVTNNPVAFDGQNFFDTDHPVSLDDAGLGTYSNLEATWALTLDNYGKAKARMRGTKGADGRRVGARGTLLVVSPSNEEKAKTILNSQYYPRLADGAALGNGDVGFVENVWKGSADLLVIDDLEDTPQKWFLFDTSKPIMPFNFQIRQAPVFAYLMDPTAPNVFFNREFVMGVEALGNVDCTIPWLGFCGGSGL
jgi:phage major head subunit gpT-like protein